MILASNHAGCLTIHTAFFLSCQGLISGEKIWSLEASSGIPPDLSTAVSIVFSSALLTGSTEPVIELSSRTGEAPIIFFVLNTASRNPYVRGPMIMPTGPRTKTGAAKASVLAT